MSTFGKAKPHNPVFQYGHPLAQGMVAFTALTENSGTIRYTDVSTPYINITECVQNINVAHTALNTTQRDAGFTGSPFGAAIVNTDTTSGGQGQARLDFGGASNAGGASGIDVPQLALSKFSIGVIVNVTVFSVANAWLAGRVVPSVANPYIRYGIQADGSNTRFAGYVSTGGSGTLSSPCLTATLNTNQWYVLVFTGDGTKTYMYQDSILQNTVTVGSPDPTLAGRFVVMGNPENGGPQLLNGKIAGVAVWNRSLSQAEVAQWTYDPFEVIRKPFKFYLLLPTPAVETFNESSYKPTFLNIPQPPTNKNTVMQVLETINSGQGGGGHNDPPPKRSQYPYGIQRQVYPNRKAIEEFPWAPETSIETTLIEATQVPPRLFIPREPKRDVVGFVNARDLPPEIETAVIEATLFPEWLLWKDQWRRRYVDVQQNPAQPPPSSDTPLIESTQVPGWKFIARQPRRFVEGFNPFLPPLLRTCEITTLFTTNYKRANPNPMMPVAKITRIYKVKGLVEC